MKARPIPEQQDQDATAKHLAAVTEASIMDLAQGRSFLVICPQCEAEWAMAVAPMSVSGLSNDYSSDAVERRFHKLAQTPPLATCGFCLFTKAQS